MADTNRAPDDMIRIDREYTAVRWPDRIRILFGCRLRQSLPIAIWIDDDRKVSAKVPMDGGVTVARYFDRTRALPEMSHAEP